MNVCPQASKQVLKYVIGKSIDDCLKFNAAVSNYTIPSNDLIAAIRAFAQRGKIRIYRNKTVQAHGD